MRSFIMSFNIKNVASALVLFSVTSVSLANEQMNGGDRQSGERRGPPPFSELDLNADGVLTMAEFEQHQLPRGDHASLFNRVDENGDGSILEDEWSSHKPPGEGRGQKGGQSR